MRAELTHDEKALAFRALLRSDFASFVAKVFQTVAPGQTYISEWYIDAIAYKLQRVHSGDVKRLIINLPPRSLKSIMASVALPAFILGHDPTRRIICASYSNELSNKHANDFRAVIGSPWYRQLFPGTCVGNKDSETEIEFAARGFRFATSVGGTLTGRGGDLIVIDDPLKPIDALSETKRMAANQWFNSTVLSRLDSKQNGAILIVMQRVHIDDLTGFVQQASDDWTMLNLPAIATVDVQIPLGRGRYHRRREGDVLSPSREPPSVLENLRRSLGSDLFSAQYQQEPVPPGGAMIKRHWIQRYDEVPSANSRSSIVQSWDTASKGGPGNDWSVCSTWKCIDANWYLLHVWRGRVDYPTLKAKVQDHARHWKANRVLVEEAGSAIGLIQELRSRVIALTAVKPQKDKETRMAIASGKIEAGQVFLPRQAPWLSDLEAELFAFPGSRHDDQVDSISQALNSSANGLEVWRRAFGNTLKI